MDPGHFFKIYWFLKKKNNFQFFCFIFILKPFRNDEIFIIFLFPKVQIWVSFFFLQFLVDFNPLDPDPWVRIFLRIREAKILRIQRIRILSKAVLSQQFIFPLQEM